jgi:hypothetical protein
MSRQFSVPALARWGRHLYCLLAAAGFSPAACKTLADGSWRPSRDRLPADGIEGVHDRLAETLGNVIWNAFRPAALDRAFRPLPFWHLIYTYFSVEFRTAHQHQPLDSDPRRNSPPSWPSSGKMQCKIGPAGAKMKGKLATWVRGQRDRRVHPNETMKLAYSAIVAIKPA